MTRTIDLNADLGEGFGPWTMGDDTGLIGLVTSVNVACGFHAGDPDVMARTMAAAVAAGVGIGAHPGLPDLQGFGRRRLQISPDEAANLVTYQVGAAQAMARAAGGAVRHVKLHGALANMAAEDAGLAAACFEGALAADPGLILLVIAGTAQETAAREIGAALACEVFADRAYAEDGLLMDRRLPGAVLHDPVAVLARVQAMIEEGAVITARGNRLPTRIDTICLHGDGPGAMDRARHLRHGLEGAGILLRPFR
ncbi:MAG TPA: 5-oxoprolinase subunit PxpA [Paracoccaceae bacterium]|nr:5-oxoprolinase subunit PxpA [Paracoccaceae bacterium]HMO71238.1 5-oxoprolinase subunit PxpA [Paracoccaceae bacterium]